MQWSGTVRRAIKPGIGKGDADPRIIVKHSSENLETLFLPKIVDVDNRHVAPARSLDSGIARTHHTAVLLFDVADAVPIRKDFFFGIVGRAVVDDDHLEIVPGLL